MVRFIAGFAVAIVITGASVRADAGEVRALIPDRPWEIAIQLDGFEPDDILMSKCVLGGQTAGGVTVTVIMEAGQPGMTPAEARYRFGDFAVAGFGVKEEAKTVDADGLAILYFPWRMDADHWSYRGYVVREDMVFDVHLSADTADRKAEAMIAMLKSFAVRPSQEWQDMADLIERLDQTQAAPEQVRAIEAFSARYPANSWAEAFLARAQQDAKAELPIRRETYARALSKHQTMPITNPFLLWECLLGLGRTAGMMGDYAVSRPNLERAYDMAAEIERPGLIADAAYDLACWHAEEGDLAEAARFLREALENEPALREHTRTDSSLEKLRAAPEYAALLAAPEQ